MKKHIYIYIYISILTLTAISLPVITSAINTVIEGFRISSAPVTIDAHGVCQVVNVTSGNDLFVPTKTASEWQAFRDNRPIGQTNMSACAFIGTCTWTQTGTQSCALQHPALIADSDCASFSGFAGSGSSGSDDGSTCIHGAWAGDGSPYGSCGGSQTYQQSYQCMSGTICDGSDDPNETNYPHISADCSSPTPASSLGVNSSCCFGGTGCYGVCS